jgi:hypothetical protein
MEIDVTPLLGRIDAEICLSRSRLRARCKPAPTHHSNRVERLALFENACEKLREIWGPRLDAVQHRLSEKLRIPALTHSGRRQAGLAFTTAGTQIHMTFMATTDTDVRELDLEYALDVLPALATSPGRSRFQQPLEPLDSRDIEEWVDTRIVEGVRTCLFLVENQSAFTVVRIIEVPIVPARPPKCGEASTSEHRAGILCSGAHDNADDHDPGAPNSLAGLRGAYPR